MWHTLVDSSQHRSAGGHGPHYDGVDDMQCDGPLNDSRRGFGVWCGVGVRSGSVWRHAADCTLGDILKAPNRMPASAAGGGGGVAPVDLTPSVLPEPGAGKGGHLRLGPGRLPPPSRRRRRRRRLSSSTRCSSTVAACWPPVLLPATDCRSLLRKRGVGCRALSRAVLRV